MAWMRFQGSQSRRVAVSRSAGGSAEFNRSNRSLSQSSGFSAFEWRVQPLDKDAVARTINIVSMRCNHYDRLFANELIC